MQTVGRYLAVFPFALQPSNLVRLKMVKYPQQKTAPTQGKNHLPFTSELCHAGDVDTEKTAQTFCLVSNNLNGTGIVHICYQTIQVNVVVRGMK